MSRGPLQQEPDRAGGQQAGRGELVRQVPVALRAQQAAALPAEEAVARQGRKELLQCGVLSAEKDLYLGKLALTKFPKSPETWIHRRWVLQRMQRDICPGVGERKEQVDGEGGGDHRDGGHRDGDRGDSAEDPLRSERLRRLLQEEMRVCADAAGRYPSNYNAWSHRIWVLHHLAKGNLKILHDELSSMRLWVSMHVSDHSGFHYRQFLLRALVRELSHHQNQSQSQSSSHQTQTQTQQQQSPSSPRSSSTPSATAPSSSPSSPPPPHRSPAGSPTQPNGEASTLGSEGLGGPLTSAAISELFQDEMELCTDLIEAYPGHETLWCHRRHVFYLWHQWRQECDLSSSSSSSAQANGSSSSSPHLLNHALVEPPAATASPVPAHSRLKCGPDSEMAANGQPMDMEVDGEEEEEEEEEEAAERESTTAADVCPLSDNIQQQQQSSCSGGSGGAGGVSGSSSSSINATTSSSSSSGGCYMRDTKRLKRGPAPACPPPSLAAEEAFVSSVLSSCRSPEQRRFAASYRKWLASVIGH
ncbi:protein prenyltransferase alpha subunit repeat-containing protein 1 isoform X2 [Engraulis encrasicolus]|uniref:protein prenyltransferase alpha subunit repeat-containing protein 1 isoform X2 n=1 Tax=Engraulis encrasicolus TaxID=184585 RepID=UPI002FD45513